ncbi:MAG: acetoacetate--CoA ligase [Acidobacteria bacterium]|nr:acetoacetate--CoA ligase [Acidobacteriota bacterium]
MQTHLARFLALAGKADYAELHAWSVAEGEAFWALLRRYAELPDGEFNFAEVLLRGCGAGPALLYRDESGAEEQWSGEDLKRAVACYAQLLRGHGIIAGDRVVGLLPNRPETVALMLAVASVGAVWSSCSPDFGASGIIDRFAQLKPRLLFTTAWYEFGGKRFELAERIEEVVRAVPWIEATHFIEGIGVGGDAELRFERLSPKHALFILFSSGTTGLPKCIVHSSGGTLVQLVKEHLLHVDVQPGERLFYYTTCGWMMWNWLAVGLASRAVLVLYHGSPMWPDAGVLWRMVERDGVAHFGTSAKYLALLEKSGYKPREHHNLSALRQVLSTGSPLLAESFDFVWRDVMPDVHLASISGGTDIVSCFVLGNPLGVVKRGEIQVAGLGMDVQIWNEQGRRVWDEAGELVCVNPFPSMPLGFWNDTDGAKFKEAYFARFEGVWCHGDWAMQSSETGGFVIYGRSDTTLNPGGIRIGTAEIYRQVEAVEELEEAVAIGQEWKGDVRIVLFVKMRGGFAMDEAVREKIRGRLKREASPHHVPKKILEVGAIPRTVSGKISEAAVRDAVHGRVSKNLNALANPESIKEFTGRGELLQD